MFEGKYKIEYGEGFLRDVKKLPRNIQEKLAELLTIAHQDIFHPFLHTKPLAGKLKGKYSFRITQDYRVGFKIEKNNIIRLLVAENRKQIYKTLKRKL